MAMARFDVAARNCYALAWSYGEICVGCGCCSTNKLKKAKARLEYHKERLKDRENFDYWFCDDEELLALQKRNVAAGIEYEKAKVAEYEKLVRELEADNG